VWPGMDESASSTPGLRHLARAALEVGHRVTVATPAEEASGSSAATSAAEKDGRIVAELPTSGPTMRKRTRSGYTRLHHSARPARRLRIPALHRPVRRQHRTHRTAFRNGRRGAHRRHRGTACIAASLEVLTAAVAAAGTGGADNVVRRDFDRQGEPAPQLREDRLRQSATAGKFRYRSTRPWLIRTAGPTPCANLRPRLGRPHHGAHTRHPPGHPRLAHHIGVSDVPIVTPMPGVKIGVVARRRR
jgi:hypothetical protein